MSGGFVVERIDSPLGEMLLVADPEGRLCAADFADCETRMRTLLSRRFGPAGKALAENNVPPTIKTALASYFAGELDAIDHVSVRLGGTSFHESVWTGLRGIQAGHRLTYAALAGRIGQPQAPRAVGRANAANPLSIVIPCHRLVGATGALIGYAGGLHRKHWLLEHEAKHACAARAASA